MFAWQRSGAVTECVKIFAVILDLKTITVIYTVS